MKFKLLGAILAAGLVTSAAQAATVTVAGDALEIATPATVTNGAPGNNDNMQWFKESSSVTVTSDVSGLGGSGLLKDTVVDTYMIFLNREDSAKTLLQDSDTFTFSTAILAVFGQADGGDLVATDYLATSTTYTNFDARGIENGNNGSLTAGAGNDTISYAGNTLDVFFKVTQPGDWIRVAVEADVSAVPVPAGALMLPFGLAALFAFGRRGRKQKAA